MTTMCLIAFVYGCVIVGLGLEAKRYLQSRKRDKPFEYKERHCHKL